MGLHAQHYLMKVFYLVKYLPRFFLLRQNLSKTEQMSHWARRPLTPSQVEYAALDVISLVQIHTVFMSKFPGSCGMLCVYGDVCLLRQTACQNKHFERPRSHFRHNSSIHSHVFFHRCKSVHTCIHSNCFLTVARYKKPRRNTLQQRRRFRNRDDSCSFHRRPITWAFASNLFSWVTTGWEHTGNKHLL